MDTVKKVQQPQQPFEEAKQTDISLKDSEVIISNKHDFDYLLILDFEATCSNTERFSVQEIIEFPIVILDVKTNTILKEEFHTYIKPSVNQKLTEFCKDLTKITQEQVDSGIYIEEALNQVEDFLVKQKLKNKSFIFVTCGDFDLGKCLYLEAKYKNINYADYFKSYINIKKAFPKEWYAPTKPQDEGKIQSYGKQKERTLGMAGMLNVLHLKLQGTHHSGIDDSRNIARIAQEMISRGVVFSKGLVATVAPKYQPKEKNYKMEDKRIKGYKPYHKN